ncbi:MAG: hypothetical protein ACKVPX_05075 [Myxococcaceae bacterium]
MRTTIDIDDALLEKLKALADKRKTSLRAVLNDVLGRSLSRPVADAKAPVYRVQPFHSAWKAGVDSGRLNQLSDELEVSASKLRP